MSIQTLEQEKEEYESKIKAFSNEIIMHKLGKENAIRVREIVENELEYYKDFTKKIKALNYDIDVSEVPDVPVGLLDIIYKAIEGSIKSLRETPKKEDPKIQSENEETGKLKEMLSEYIEKYTKIIDKKNQFITSLQNMLEKKRQGNDDIEKSEEYQKLKLMKMKEQESYEEGIKDLKKKMADTEGKYVNVNFYV